MGVDDLTRGSMLSRSDRLRSERGTILTNGVGINALAVAEYAVMGVLVAAKRYDEVGRARTTGTNGPRTRRARSNCSKPAR